MIAPGKNLDAFVDGLVDDLADRVADAVARRLGAHTKQAEPDGLVDGDELARYLGCSRPTVDRLKASGEISYIRLGRSVKYRVVDVLKQLEAREGESCKVQS